MHSCSITAFEASGVFQIALTLVCRMLWVSAERPAAAGESRTRRDHRIGRLDVLDPVDDRLPQIETVERCSTCRAVPRSGHEIRPAGVCAHLLDPTGPRRHAFVVVDGVERREPRIAYPVVVDNLSAVPEEAVEVGPVRRVRQPLYSIRVHPILDLVDVDRLERTRIDRAARPGGENTANRNVHGGDAAVPWERRIGRGG